MKCFLMLIFLGLLGCSSLEKKDCNYDYGFATGVNDAKADLPMNKKLDPKKVCHVGTRRELIRGYREGYSIEMRTRVAQTHLTKPTVYSSDKLYVPECKVAYGERVCGYGCLVIYGQVRCAKNPGSGCLAAFGDIRCGRNCEVNINRIDCASYE